MRRALALAAGAVAFLIVATANSGGYRYGISDQAFYVPAVAHAADTSLFPRDASMLEVQTSKWLGDDILGWTVRTTGIEMPRLFVLLYVAGGMLLFAGVVSLARGLGASWWAVTGATALLTLRHRIAKTGANSLEGYMHPRMIAFALGLIAVGFMLRRRWGAAILVLGLSALAHPTTAIFFGAVYAFCLIRDWKVTVPPWLRQMTLVSLGFLGTITVLLILSAPFDTQRSRMTLEWLAVLDEKDYLFSHRWPLYAWVINLLYPVIILSIYRSRRSAGLTSPGEALVVDGLIGLVVLFLISVPFAALDVIPIVQMQANRVFWVLDAFAAIYVSWWLIDRVPVARSHSTRTALVAFFVLLACGRGVFILTDTGRAFATIDLPRDEWTDAMRWLRSQPKDWQVLADPEHAWRYGTSVRVAALRDTVLERSKDSAMAMYDSGVALRVADRSRALADFGSLSVDQLRQLAGRYKAQALVVERDRALALPQLYANNRFAIYDLR